MTNKAPKFHFNGEYTDYTTHLGALCPDKYGHEPEKGDTVEVGVKFLDVTIEKGVVSKKLPESKQMVVIREKLDSFEGLDDEDNEYIDKVFDFSTSYDFGSTTRGCLVKFSEKVAESFVIKNLGELGDFSSGKDLTFGKMKAKVFGTVADGYHLRGELKGFIDGYSVLSTRDMDAYKEMHATKTDVENVAWSDRVLPSKLIEDLNTSLDEICRK